MWEAAPYTVTDVAGLSHPQTFDKMMGDRKDLVSVVLSFLSREIAYVFHFTPWSRTPRLTCTREHNTASTTTNTPRSLVSGAGDC